MDFKLAKREVKTPRMILKLEIELNESTLTDQEAADRLSFLINSYHAKEFSELIVFLLRETKSSTWELKALEINQVPQESAGSGH